MANDWTKECVARLKGQKQRSEAQELIVLLAGKDERTDEEEKQFNLLLKAERAKERAKAAERAAAKMLGAKKDEERKARNHRLILIGAAVEAGLEKNQLRQFLNQHIKDEKDRKAVGLI